MLHNIYGTKKQKTNEQILWKFLILKFKYSKKAHKYEKISLYINSMKIWMNINQPTLYKSKINEKSCQNLEQAFKNGFDNVKSRGQIANCILFQLQLCLFAKKDSNVGRSRWMGRLFFVSATRILFATQQWWGRFFQLSCFQTTRTTDRDDG